MLDSQTIIVVYLGQTNNVRTRLQQYGRVGAHLHSGRLISSEGKECSGLFTDVFSRGYSIMFRWAPMVDKKKAEKTEAELLAVFDYAWNKSGNGVCRHDEILSKLDGKRTAQISTFRRKLQPWKHPAFGSKAGINIDDSVPLDDQKGFLPSLVFKFRKSQLRFVHADNSFYEDHKICGVAIGNGSVCKNKPMMERKRCEEHKGKKIVGGVPVSVRFPAMEEATTTCGVVLKDGSLCAELPAYGRKRCEMHKGSIITKLEPHNMAVVLFEDQKETPISKRQSQVVVKHEQEYSICGVIDDDGRMCRNTPVWGRKRCAEHKGQRATASNLRLPTSRECWETAENGNICGAVTNGHICRRKPASGRKRCEDHKGQRITEMLPGKSIGVKENYNVSVCGIALSNGSSCQKTPVTGRKRCELHKGRKIT
ncbi:protein EFFECTOR OF TRANSCRIPTION 2-like isoform X2 [Asparagus officinalis]|nr:protein EFFECTOR OF TRANSCRIPTION 2-like isoform X2 [Asparagus officinalis]